MNKIYRGQVEFCKDRVKIWIPREIRPGQKTITLAWYEMPYQEFKRVTSFEPKKPGTIIVPGIIECDKLDGSPLITSCCRKRYRSGMMARCTTKVGLLVKGM